MHALKLHCINCHILSFIKPCGVAQSYPYSDNELSIFGRQFLSLYFNSCKCYISCTNLTYSKHHNLLDHLCSKVINALTQCADRAISKRGGKRLAAWSKEVNPLKDKTLLWNKIWHEAGCASTGVLSQLKKHAKARYKYTVRRLETGSM